VRVCIELKHFGTEPVDDPERHLPENVLVRLGHERLERVGDLVAHVGVGEVEARVEGSLQLGCAVDAVRYRVFAQQVHEHHVGRRNEALVLPALEQKSPVDVAEPEDHLSAVKVFQFKTPAAHEVPQRAEQLPGGRLDNDPLLDRGDPSVLDEAIAVFRGDRGHRDRDRRFGFLLFGLVRLPDVVAVELSHLA